MQKDWNKSLSYVIYDVVTRQVKLLPCKIWHTSQRMAEQQEQNGKAAAQVGSEELFAQWSGCYEGKGDLFKVKEFPAKTTMDYILKAS